MPDSNLGELDIEWGAVVETSGWWRPLAVWKYDSAIKRGRMAGMLGYAREKYRGGDTARRLRPIKAQFKASDLFFLLTADTAHDAFKCWEWWRPVCVHRNMIGETWVRRNGVGGSGV